MKNACTIIIVLFLAVCRPSFLKAQEQDSKTSAGTPENKTKKPVFRKEGFYFGPSAGLWFPDGKNRVMGHPVLPGLIMELKSGKSSISLTFDFIINEGTKDTLYIKYNDELLKKNKFAGGQIGLDFDHEIFSREKFSIEAGAGLGYGMMTYHNPNKDVHVGRSGFYFSPGLSFRYFVSNNSFIKLRTQYYVANYRLKDDVSTDFSGNYPTVKLIYAWR